MPDRNESTSANSVVASDRYLQPAGFLSVLLQFERLLPRRLRSTGSRLLLAISIPWLVFGASYLGQVWQTGRDAIGSLPAPARRQVPGEFERQSTILLAWPSAFDTPYPDHFADMSQLEDRVYCDMARAIYRSVDVVVVTRDSRSQRRIERLLESSGVPAAGIRFIRTPLHSKWIRDYGPLGVRTGRGSLALLDADYFDNTFLAIDPHQDRLPSRLGEQLGLPTVRVPLGIEHGNLLSNGDGLLVTTEKLLEDNRARGYDAAAVRTVLRRCYGATDVVVLENLVGEPTGHIDMFATFTAADTVAVSSFRTDADPINAAILDRNATRLAALTVANRPLRVVRLPTSRMSSPAGHTLWPSYTNVVFANDTLLVPICLGADQSEASRACSIYKQLLPGWKVVTVDARPLIYQFGGLHCATMNLAAKTPQAEAGCLDE